MRVVTGYRPTGRLHLGHLVGNISSMKKLQSEYDSFFFIADWHALTTDYESPQHLAGHTRELVLDWIAAGIDPFKATIYKQSDVPEVSELAMALSMITPLGWLERNPTYKDQMRDHGERSLATHGFLGYPILMCADVAIVGAQKVPVGSDQVPHLELAREIIRRFNRYYGDIFPEPDALLTEVSLLPGPDGRKMSKSFGNVIWLDDSPEQILKVVQTAITDPAKIKRDDPGNPEICNVYKWWQALLPDRAPEVASGCRAGTLGCVADKNDFAQAISEHLAPFRERRAELAAKPNLADEVLAAGRAKVRPIATEAIARVRDAMGISSTKDTR